MRSFIDALSDASLDVAVAASAEEALAHLANDGIPDIVLTDVRMPGRDGIELLRLLKARLSAIDVVQQGTRLVKAIKKDSGSSRPSRVKEAQMRGYPLTVESDDNGTLLVPFVDIPEVHAFAKDEDEVSVRATDCVLTVLLSGWEAGIRSPSRRAERAARRPRKTGRVAFASSRAWAASAPQGSQRPS